MRGALICIGFPLMLAATTPAAHPHPPTKILGSEKDRHLYHVSVATGDDLHGGSDLPVGRWMDGWTRGEERRGEERGRRPFSNPLPLLSPSVSRALTRAKLPRSGREREKEREKPVEWDK